MQDFHSLDVWQRAHALTLRVYRDTHSIPQEEVFGVKMWLRRAAVAIPTAISEGCGRENNAAFATDLRRAIVKCNEVEYLVLLSQDLKLFRSAVSEPLTADTIEVRKMAFGLLRKL